MSFRHPRLFAPHFKSTARKSALESVFRLALPLALVIACALVACEFLKSQAVVQELARTRAIEAKLSSAMVTVHKVKSRQLQYMLTGSEDYLAPNGRDIEAISATFLDLGRLLANDPDQQRRLVRFHATAQKLLDVTSQATAKFHDGDTQAAKNILASDTATSLLRDSGIGSNEILRVERTRLTKLQKARELTSDNALAGMLLLFLAQGGYCIFRMMSMAAYARKQKRTMAALETARQAAEKDRQIAERANRAKSDFLASVSHELRTPLNAILGFSEMIGFQIFGPVGNARYSEYAADIHKSGRHLLSLVNDILDLSKIGAGKMNICESNFSAEELISNCLTLLGEQARSHVSLTVKVAPGLPELRGDFKLVTQILLNLVSNAAKFTPSGGQVTVDAHYIAGRGMQFGISDTGVGMSQRDIEKALSPFGQIDSKIARTHHGVGLGLPIARSYAELHGGQLILNSVPGQGTRVLLVLPEDRVLAAARKLAS
jgi:signal transduction histidine kinase